MGLWKLNKREREIWNNIETDNEVEFFLRKGARETYKSRVLEVSDSNIYIKTPAVGEVFLDFPRRTPVEVELEVHNPQSGKIKFTSEIIGQEWLKENCIKIACPRRIRWIHLRRYYRIEAGMHAEFSFVSRSKIPGDFQVEFPIFSTVVQNISEGGASLVVDKIVPIQVNSYINMKIQLSPHSLVRARGKVIHIEFAKGKCGLGIEWITMERKSKDDLRKFIFSSLKDNKS